MTRLSISCVLTAGPFIAGCGTSHGHPASITSGLTQVEISSSSRSPPPGSPQVTLNEYQCAGSLTGSISGDVQPFVDYLASLLTGS